MLILRFITFVILTVVGCKCVEGLYMAVYKVKNCATKQLAEILKSGLDITDNWQSSSHCLAHASQKLVDF